MRKFVFALTTAAIAFGATQASAQTAESGSGGGLDEIIVTAQKREQNQQSVPVAVSVVTAETLENKNVTTFSNLTAISPSLTITEGSNPTSATIILRGIGTAAVSIGIEPSVAVVVDDVAILQQAQAFSGLNDISRIEVLRGPQGTLFGKNASAGAINIVTAAPTDVLSGRVRASATTDSQFHIEGGLSGRMSENAGFRVNAFYDNKRGFIRNTFTNKRIGKEEAYGFRAKLQLEPTERLTVTLTGDYTKSEGEGSPRTFRAAPAGATVFGVPITADIAGINVGEGNYAISQNIDPVVTSRQYSFSGRLQYELGAVDLISISAYQNWNLAFFEDGDLTSTPKSGSAIGLIQQSPFSSDQFSQEFRLVSSTPGPLQYLFGLYYSKGETSRTFDRGPMGPLLSNWSATAGTRTIAAFAQGTYDLAETTHLDLGLRFNNEVVDVAFTNLIRPATLPANNATCLVTCTGEATDDEVTGKIALRQDVAERVMVYASYSTGYKGQGFDVSSGFSPARAASPVLPETSKSYELGLKSRFFDNRVQLNITAFLVDYNNFQAQSAVVRDDLSIEFKLNNVGRLRTKGVEFELQAQPSDLLRLDFNAAYTDAVVREFPTANCFAGQTAAQGCFDVDGAGPGTARAQNLAGKRLANSPEWKLNATAEFHKPVSDTQEAFVNIDYRWQSAVNFDLAQNPLFVQKGYGLLNGSVGVRPLEGMGFTATLFVTNLLDKKYAAVIGASSGSSAGLLAQILPRDSRRFGGIRVGYSF